MQRSFNLRQIARLLDCSYSTAFRFKTYGYRYKKLPLSKLNGRTLKDIFNAMGLHYTSKEALLLIVYENTKQYSMLKNQTENNLKVFQKQADSETLSALTTKNIILSKLKANRYTRLFGDILSYKYKQIYIVDYTKNRIFSTLMSTILSYLGIEVILIEEAIKNSQKGNYRI